MSAFKVCIIGCGSIATHYHGPAYARYAGTHPDLQQVACCDVDESRAIQFRQRFGFARHFTDFSAMLDAEHPDAVCLAVPPLLTARIASDVLRRGIPLLMEKPPGLTVQEVDTLIAAARATRTPNLVAFNRRYTPLVVRLKEWLAQHCPGGIQHVRYDFTRIGRTDADFSTTAIHGIDTARHIAGSDYAHVHFHYQPLPSVDSSTVNVYMDCTFTSGATAHLAFCPVAGAVTERATVYAHDQTFALHLPIWNGFDAPGRLQHIHKGTLVADETGPVVSGSADDMVLNGFYAENAAFFDDVRTGRCPAGDVRSARQSVAIAQWMRERRADYSADHSEWDAQSLYP